MNFGPIARVTDVTVTKQVTETVTHGSFTGASDPTANSAVVSVLAVTQDGTSYIEGDDFVVSGGEIDWSSSGAEPAPGSSYDVTYRYIDSITPDAVSDTTVTVSGAVTGTTVFVDYEYKLPRVDALVMDARAFCPGCAVSLKPVTRNPRTSRPAFYRWQRSCWNGPQTASRK